MALQVVYMREEWFSNGTKFGTIKQVHIADDQWLESDSDVEEWVINHYEDGVEMGKVSLNTAAEYRGYDYTILDGPGYITHVDTKLLLVRPYEYA